MKNTIILSILFLSIIFCGCRGCRMKLPTRVKPITPKQLQRIRPPVKTVPIPPVGNSTVAGAESNAARTAFKSAKVEFKIYSSSGKVIGSSQASRAKTISASYKMKYESHSIKIIDKAFKKLDGKKITSERQLEKFINKTIEQELKSISTKSKFIEGKITFEGSLRGGEKLSYSIDIADAIKAGLAIGGSGYYILKKQK